MFHPYKSTAKLGAKAIDKVSSFGESVLFILLTIFGTVRFRGIIKQIYNIGVQSIIIIGVSALFIGFVLGLQGYYTLAKFSAQSALGPMVALSVLRELGPVITALLVAGRSGSALTSEIGLMKATEQLASLNMMGVDPLRFIVAPRFWAGIISMPLLNIIFCAIAVYGGYIVGVDMLGLYYGTFWGNMQSSVTMHDITNGIIKSFIFGVAVTWTAIYQGYSCQGNSEGIAKATTKTVVYSSLLILGLDFILTAIMFKG
jgi:phospholipid/cholesterol/gamma-HCH transport system permease protein